MTEDQIQTGGTDVDEEEASMPQFVIDLEAGELNNRAISVLIASRRCYMCQQGDDEMPTPETDAQQYVDQIVGHCAETPDYLLPDTPLKEAIFRVILANGNRPITAEEISETLSEKWAMTAYPRDISKQVIQKLLENGASYCITQLPEPEVEEPEPVEENPKVVIEPEASTEAEEPASEEPEAQDEEAPAEDNEE